jgi:lipoprotein-anchoring transpeptidase ErfK/SrfK
MTMKSNGFLAGHRVSGLSRRAAIVGCSALGATASLAGCATRSTDIDPAFMRRTVAYDASHAPGTIVVDPSSHFLYHVQQNGQAIRYGVGVGGEGFGWSGVANVHDKQEWPNWYPTKEILERKPEIRSRLHDAMGVPGGPENPLGARALYLWQGNKDTLYRIHGTNEPWTIGKSVSSGCIRMVNQDVVDLYESTAVGTKVVVLPTGVG